MVGKIKRPVGSKLPPYKASHFIGKRKRGADGRMYSVRRNEMGHYRWVPSKNTVSKKEKVRYTTPGTHYYVTKGQSFHPTGYKSRQARRSAAMQKGIIYIPTKKVHSIPRKGYKATTNFTVPKNRVLWYKSQVEKNMIRRGKLPKKPKVARKKKAPKRVAVPLPARSPAPASPPLAYSTPIRTPKAASPSYVYVSPHGTKYTTRVPIPANMKANRKDQRRKRRMFATQNKYGEGPAYVLA